MEDRLAFRWVNPVSWMKWQALPGRSPSDLGELLSFQPIKAPFVRPGVVIHEPDASADDLLAEFARSLKDRGFDVGGCVGTGEHLLDLAGGGRVEPARAASFASASFRKAMRDDADLVVIGSFHGFESAARELRAKLNGGTSYSMPVLTALAGTEISKWLNFAGQDGTLLPPSAGALWRWWGADHLYRDLALGVADDPVRRIVCGPRWLMVQGASGTGLAYLPRSPKTLIEQLAALKRKSLRELARLTESWDPLDMAVGIAAINAHYNRHDLDAALGNGADLFGQEAGRVVVVGAFPGMSETLKNPQVIEVEPRPGEFPVVAMDSLLPGCAAAVVASSSVVNRSLSRILKLAVGSKVALCGPSTPLSPRLHRYGVDVMGGLVIRDPSGLADAIRAGALPREFVRYGQYRHIKADETVPALSPVPA